MRQSFPWGIGSRLIALAFANAVALALIAVIVWLAYGRIEGLSTEIAHKEMTGVFVNAALGREVANGLSDLDAATRGCHDRNGPSGETGRIDERLTALAGGAADPDWQTDRDSIDHSVLDPWEGCDDGGSITSGRGR